MGIVGAIQAVWVQAVAFSANGEFFLLSNTQSQTQLWGLFCGEKCGGMRMGGRPDH